MTSRTINAYKQHMVSQWFYLSFEDIYLLVGLKWPHICFGCWISVFRVQSSGQIIATSHDLTPNGGLVREIPLFQGNLGWWNIIIWPESSKLRFGYSLRTSHQKGECVGRDIVLVAICSVNVVLYIPETQMTVVLIVKGHLLEGWIPKNRGQTNRLQVPTKLYMQIRTIRL